MDRKSHLIFSECRWKKHIEKDVIKPQKLQAGGAAASSGVTSGLLLFKSLQVTCKVALAF